MPDTGTRSWMATQAKQFARTKGRKHPRTKGRRTGIQVARMEQQNKAAASSQVKWKAVLVTRGQKCVNILIFTLHLNRSCPGQRMLLHGNGIAESPHGYFNCCL